MIQARYPFVTAWAVTAAAAFASTRAMNWNNATGWLLLAVLAESWKAPSVKARRRTWRERRRRAYRRWYRQGRQVVRSHVVPVIQARYPEHAARIDGAVSVARASGAPGLWRGIRATAPRR